MATSRFLEVRSLMAVISPFPCGSLAKHLLDDVVEVYVWVTASHEPLPVQFLQLGECLVPRTITKLGTRAINPLALAVVSSKNWNMLSSTQAGDSAIPQWHEDSEPVSSRLPPLDKVLRN
tara:strand:- start:105 stop:464 length:360 start_codon:yes stop_codon:yes gene_type:complete